MYRISCGLGLPSLVANKLNMNVIATDGDDDVIQLLHLNALHNKLSIQIKKLQ